MLYEVITRFFLGFAQIWRGQVREELMAQLLAALAASYLINASIVNQTQKQIRNDLNAARVVLEQEQQRLHEVVRFTARSTSLAQAMETGDQRLLASELAAIRQQEKLDILNVTRNNFV